MLVMNENFGYLCSKDKDIIQKFCKTKEDDEDPPAPNFGTGSNASDAEINLISN